MVKATIKGNRGPMELEGDMILGATIQYDATGDSGVFIIGDVKYSLLPRTLAVMAAALLKKRFSGEELAHACGKVFTWLKKMGGLSAMKERNEKKAKILYDFLDESKLFKGTVEKKDRSLMNVPFVTGDADLDALFVKEAKEAGFVNLKGHRTVGGMRASIYNAMPIEGVEKLVAFMREFEKKHTN